LLRGRFATVLGFDDYIENVWIGSAGVLKFLSQRAAAEGFALKRVLLVVE
jgi:hypothetical protein